VRGLSVVSSFEEITQGDEIVTTPQTPTTPDLQAQAVANKAREQPWRQLRAAVEATPVRQETLGGQWFTYVKQADVIALIDRFAALAAPQADPRQAVASEGPGPSLAQEPKYTVNGSAIVNRASGEAIPADEPVFIFRARDVHAREAIEVYACELAPGLHRDAVVQRVADFAGFSYANPTRMKEPDTAAIASPPLAQAQPMPQAEQASVPDGFVLVPREPTEAMLVAGADTPGMGEFSASSAAMQARGYPLNQNSFRDGSALLQAYRAMLAAAPLAEKAAGRAAAEMVAHWRPLSEAPEGVRVLLGPRNAPVVGMVSQPVPWEENQDPTCCVVHYNGCVLVAGYRCSEWCALHAAPTPTASIAPKAEGEAKTDWDPRTIARFGPAVNPYIVPKAAPVAQAAAGAKSIHQIALENIASEKPRREAASKSAGSPERMRCFHCGFAWGLDTKPFHAFGCAYVEATAALSPRPEADADRASGGGV
jgi:hypothetical protein